MSITPEHPIDAQTALLGLSALLEGRAAALQHRVHISFAVIDGPSFTLDSEARPTLSEGWTDTADITVVATQRALCDLLLGKLDPAAPLAGQFFVWGGRAETFEEIVRVLRASKSLFDAHLSALRRE
jgi:hypothetical protein